MIYTLTLNPALDYIVRLPAIREGQTNRATYAELQFGGKGINVSCVLAELGVESTALGFAAGFTGDALTAYLTERGIFTDFVRLAEGLTRINIKLKTPESLHPETEINAAGPDILPTDVNTLLDKLVNLKAGDTLVMAGSVPKSLPRNVYCRFMAVLKNHGVRFVVDAEGEVLTATLPYSPFLIKPNRAELEGIAGRPLPTDDDLRKAAAELQKAGARNVLVSLGSEGAMLLDAEGGYHRVPALPVTPINTVGAGDSMVAGFLAGLDRGYDYALKLATACGGATAGSEGLATGKTVMELMK